ncbi:uncharacterized protein DNG_03755 [Cephalotrichum gorgonifer]|uniref:Uncharacterized protein n=1 Tax=Cephalotrichum gorgonifer TaxID=2041049 RepID=A0AAE8MVV9_9PEZI|nr:uncharacterized protein DNG_03755 [Cephalotrichum gorgonifer]
MAASSLAEPIRDPPCTSPPTPASDRWYVSFPPFRETPNTTGTHDPSSQTTSSSVAGTPDSTRPITPNSTAPSPAPTAAHPGSVASDAGCHTRYHACANFGICGGWVVVAGTACGVCVRGKAGSVLDGLRGGVFGSQK